MIRGILALLLVAELCPAATIILVRHAERNAGMSADVLLNARGEERAKALANVLKEAKITSVFVNELRRVQQTAEPTAQEFHLQTTVIPDKEMDSLVSRLKALPEGETVLVVGRANTVPMLVEKLGGASVPALGDEEYDRMVVVTTGQGKPSVLTLRYGDAAR
jgi:broad specificity phosphatase PhoE